MPAPSLTHSLPRIKEVVTNGQHTKKVPQGKQVPNMQKGPTGQPTNEIHAA